MTPFDDALALDLTIVNITWEPNTNFLNLTCQTRKVD